MIHLFNVSKVYPNGTVAVFDINLRINKGEFVFLVGPSGAGKSTLTRLIFREQLPTSGQIYFRERNVLRLRQRELLALRRQIGMVFQDFRLLPRKTVFENVAFALEVLGRSRRVIREQVPLALAQVGLTGKEDAFPAELSGGEQQRVGVARAIVKKPLLILADEPTGNLDPDTSWELMELFERVNRDGTTVVIATHAWDIVNRMRKRVVALENGRLVRDEEQGSYSHGA
ncbi:cell division ATP-binding protein FtsE [Candidatus Desulforudis audaxviator]|uniref:Cell division ATP-binding protein FtsE n=1 Tax=Desulforudis audaxviator (strain MP104C) TaxID=477974 RepID=B1I131_DESAP|nr:cell division ATP-binding protein FtsE [Candidatus Desulforudis audaxviator]ACA58845.1 cell division ATP-binding protein FtsE [Candidatus Desulforudis audaxviator MP104C]AZK58858.1 Cell division transporter, ATP-binding protein FtsE [Candidatus Desulforudis audaxviator]